MRPLGALLPHYFILPSNRRRKQARAGPERDRAVIKYRSFRNPDVPQLWGLWNSAELGPRAALDTPIDLSFEMLTFSQTYFDHDGLIVAVDDDDDIVGFVHAGFGCNDTESDLDYRNGVICAVMVTPNCRRQGVGRELVARAKAWLKSKGAEHIFAGPSPHLDPFYFGMYGGARPVGFQKSDPCAAPFFEKLGFQPAAEYINVSRPMDARDPVSFRLTMVRRKWELALVDHPEPCTWWWMTHYGRMDALYCVLIPRGGGPPVAGVTVAGLDAYQPSWGETAIGLSDLWVADEERRKGFGQTLLLEVIRRLRQESIRRVTANVPADNLAAVGVFRSAGFDIDDQAVVFKAAE